MLQHWCFTKIGYTLQNITASGIASRIRMENETFLVCKDFNIKLSKEQKKNSRGSGKHENST